MIEAQILEIFSDSVRELCESQLRGLVRTDMSGEKASNEVKDGSEKEATFKPFEQSLSGEFRPDYPWKKVKKSGGKKEKRGMQR